MRNCPKCNVRVLDDEAKFCIECGASLEEQRKFFPVESIVRKTEPITDTHEDDEPEEIQPELTPEERKKLFELAADGDTDATDKLLKLAEAGDAELMYYAFIIEKRRQNNLAAKDLLKKSADGEYIPAMLDLADSATDFDISEEEAFNLYEKVIAVDENNFRAANGLANAYLYGRGTRRDFSKAVEWYEKAAALGYIPALLSVGNMYCYGNGVTQDKSKALNYYLRADDMLSKTDNPNLYRVSAPTPYYIAALKFKIAGMYRRNDGVPVNLELSDEFYKQAFDIYSKFLETKIDLPPILIKTLKNDCYFKIGMMYYRGYGVEKNYWMAINRFQEAADNGNSYANTILQAENGDPKKMDELSELYSSGQELVGIEKDLSKAEYWAKKAREARGEPEEKTPPPSPPPQTKPVPPPPVTKKPVNVKKVINELYSEYGSIRAIYFYGKSDKAMRKINNAVEAYAKSAAHENIIFIFDDTTFGSARDGFLITDKMFYCHNIGEDRQFVRLEEVQEVKFVKKTTGIRCLKVISKDSSDIKVEMANSTDSSATQIVNLVKEVVKIFAEPEDAKEYIRRGINYANKFQDEKAVQEYNKALELNPTDFKAYYRRAMSYSNLNRYEEAIQDFDKAIELSPNEAEIEAEIYNYRGFTYMYSLKKYERAIQDFDKAIELNPNYANAYDNRGWSYCCLNQHNRAIQDYDRALQLNPNDFSIYNDRGLAFYNLKQYERAIQDFDKAIKIYPKYFNAYNNRGLCYQALGDDVKAKADFDKAKELGYNG